MHHESMSLSHGWWTMDLFTLTTPTTFPTQEIISLLVLDRPEPVAAHYVTALDLASTEEAYLQKT